MPLIFTQEGLYMVKKSLVSLSLLLCLQGCNQSALSVFGDDSLYERGLQYTQVADIVQSFETKAIINATYLNSTDSDKWDNQYENFLIGVYIAQDRSKEEDKFLNNKKYILTLNGKEYDKKEPVVKGTELYSHIPLQNPHAKYFIVSFKKVEDTNSLKLQYGNTTGAKAILTFQAQ